jgi:DNA repair exonuclease SbcCD ATPase subunit
MGSKAGLKLLARQQAEQSWNAVPGEEIIPADAANDYSAGALVLVELSSNRQIQNIYEAAKQLVGILQNFSRLREKFRTQEEEIESWKQSLIYQSQELTRRELEMEVRQEELQQLEEEFQKLEQQHQEFELIREQALQLKAEVESDRQNLEGAWEHLQEQRNRLQEHQTEQAASLDAQQIHRVEDLLNQLATTIASGEPPQSQLNSCLAMVAQQQLVLDQHWQALEQYQNNAQQRQTEVEQQASNLENSWRIWHQAQGALEKAQLELKLQEHTLSLKTESVQMLTLQIQAQEDLYQQLCQLSDGSSSDADLHQKVNIRGLEEMPLEELQTTVENLQRDLEKMSSFVNDQEEELGFQRQTVEELQAKIKHASEYDCLSLEGDLEYEQQSYQLLNQTLVGQRQSLREREEILKRHQEVLLQRSQGQSQKQQDQISLEPILEQLESQRQGQAEELQYLERQIEQIKVTVRQLQELIDHQSPDQANQHRQLKQLEQDLQEQRATVAELWGKIDTYQKTLQPLQDHLNPLRQQLTTVAEDLLLIQQASHQQKQVVEEMKNLIMTLGQTTNLGAF